MVLSRVLVLLSTLSLCVQPIVCWGSLGHRTVAYLAQKYLSSDGASYLNELISNDGEPDDNCRYTPGDISDAALWLDDVRTCGPWKYTASWHFIDSQDDPPRTCDVMFSRDCLPGPGCVVSAIMNMTSRVNDPDLSTTEHLYALKFLLHFIGDIHQPLHTEAEDRGGNQIPVLFNKKHTNLHAIWDTDILKKHVGSGDEKATAEKWAQTLFDKAGGSTMTSASECDDISQAEKCALQWASEANAYICSYVLKDDVEGVEGKNLATEYYDGAVPIVDHLVGKAGLRLGAWVNSLAAQRSAMKRNGVVFQVQDPAHVRFDFGSEDEL